MTVCSVGKTPKHKTDTKSTNQSELDNRKCHQHQLKRIIGRRTRTGLQHLIQSHINRSSVERKIEQ